MKNMKKLYGYTELIPIFKCVGPSLVKIFHNWTNHPGKKFRSKKKNNQPDFATSLIGSWRTSDMWPSNEKTTNPHNTLVPQLIEDTITASLEKKMI